MNGYSTYGPEIRVTACGRSWILRRPAELETLWESMTGDEFGADERLPYWVELWPASVTLCDWLLEKQKLLAGQPCLDMGCGLGLTAMAASFLGARVLAFDYEEEALRYAKENARLNGVPQPLWSVLDWRFPAVARASARYIWGGDVMYERRFVSPVLALLDHALMPGGRVWMAEPNRDVYQYFRGALAAGGWLARRAVTARTDALYMQPEKVSVTLWELSKE
jgi:predicted nicotinamide N-methyase